jgi:hypothetical protein
LKKAKEQELLLQNPIAKAKLLKEKVDQFDWHRLFALARDEMACILTSIEILL